MLGEGQQEIVDNRRNKGYLPEQTSAMMRECFPPPNLSDAIAKSVLFGNMEWSVTSPKKKETLEIKFLDKADSFAFTCILYVNIL